MQFVFLLDWPGKIGGSEKANECIEGRFNTDTSSIPKLSSDVRLNFNSGNSAGDKLWDQRRR